MHPYTEAVLAERTRQIHQAALDAKLPLPSTVTSSAQTPLAIDRIAPLTIEDHLIAQSRLDRGFSILALKPVQGVSAYIPPLRVVNALQIRPLSMTHMSASAFDAIDRFAQAVGRSGATTVTRFRNVGRDPQVLGRYVQLLRHLCDQYEGIILRSDVAPNTHYVSLFGKNSIPVETCMITPATRSALRFDSV